MGLWATAGTRVDTTWDTGLDVIDELFADDHVCHDPLLPTLPPGPAGVWAVVETLFAAMPDAVISIADWIEERDTLIARWTLTGTHTGELMGLPPSGRVATMAGMHMFRFRGEQIAETWISYDALGLLDRLGLVTLGIALGGSIRPSA